MNARTIQTVTPAHREAMVGLVIALVAIRAADGKERPNLAGETHESIADLRDTDQPFTADAYARLLMVASLALAAAAAEYQ